MPHSISGQGGVESRTFQALRCESISGSSQVALFDIGCSPSSVLVRSLARTTARKPLVWKTFHGGRLRGARVYSE